MPANRYKPTARRRSESATAATSVSSSEGRASAQHHPAFRQAQPIAVAIAFDEFGAETLSQARDVHRQARMVTNGMVIGAEHHLTEIHRRDPFSRFARQRAQSFEQSASLGEVHRLAVHAGDSALEIQDE